MLLVFGAPCQLRSLAGQEHGRTIPLCDIPSRYHCGASFSGMRGGGNGENTMLRLSSRAIPGSSGSPAEGSPPPVVVIELGVTSRAVIWPSPPSPVPRSAVRPPCGFPLALALIAASARSASLARSTRYLPEG